MSTLQLGQQVPTFSGPVVLNGEVRFFCLSHLEGKYVVVIFLPREMIIQCPSGLLEFSDRISEFRNINCEVIAVSCFNEKTLMAWIKGPSQIHALGHLHLPLLCDKYGMVSRAFGVLHGANVASSGGLFIIDPKQRLRKMVISDIVVGYAGNTLKYVRALQDAEKKLAEYRILDDSNDSALSSPVAKRARTM